MIKWSLKCSYNRSPETSLTQIVFFYLFLTKMVMVLWDLALTLWSFVSCVSSSWKTWKWFLSFYLQLNYGTQTTKLLQLVTLILVKKTLKGIFNRERGSEFKLNFETTLLSFYDQITTDKLHDKCRLILRFLIFSFSPLNSLSYCVC